MGALLGDGYAFHEIEPNINLFKSLNGIRSNVESRQAKGPMSKFRLKTYNF